MITVGYGDIHPVNSIEYILAIISMISTCGVFAFVINTIGVVFEELIQDEKTMK
jgi:Ion channel